MRKNTGWGLFLVIRGVFLWVLIPFATIAWLLVHSWAQGASLGQAICWYDGTFNLVLVKGLLRPFIGKEVAAKFVGLSNMGAVVPYRIRWLVEMV
ncbi:hypothetical protein DXT68_15455 [Microbacterium foliorum]|nr:hypothetical protein DXT68_15455 [Microbacterium foliorum]